MVRRLPSGGAIGFLVFWMLAVLDVGDDLPWVLTLGLHGVSGVAIILGVLGLQLSRSRSGDSGWAGWATTILVAVTRRPGVRLASSGDQYRNIGFPTT